ncbi:MAG: hypothetical protein HY366_03035 [Candidatus Aenigmarchaeota archaeon]|nr:hypothetical protein [Candidatus Aenigmarchaeota archaeon]
MHVSRSSQKGLKGRLSVFPRSSRKGQAAIEYLMNYAWAIALIIIVGVAIFGLNIGGIRNSLSTQSSQVTQAGEQLALIGYKCTTNAASGFTISLQNNGANKLTLGNPTIDVLSGGSGSGITCTPASTTLFPGETTTCATTATVSCTTVGQPYKAGVVLVYTDAQTSIQNKPVRNITGVTQSA